MTDLPGTSAGLAHQRCFNHARREAAGRCTACRRYFCRECVTEHEGRLVCAACLRRATAVGKGRTAVLGGILEAALAAGAMIAAWFVFYNVGEWLISLPSAFHEGTLWK